MEICLAPKATGEAFCMTLCAAQWHRDPFSPAGLVGTCPLKSISPSSGPTHSTEIIKVGEEQGGNAT